MNRKSFLAASFPFLAIILASCSADQDIENTLAPSSTPSAIVFRVDNAQQSRTTGRDIATRVTGFNVSALDGAQSYFTSSMSVYTTDNGSSWTTSSDAYWPSDRSLTFVAYVDGNPNGSSFRLDGGTASFTDYDVPSDVSAHSDLMYAVSGNVSRSSSNGSVGLQFRHALSQISFTAQNNSPVYSSIEILSVELGGVKGHGSYTFPQSATAGNARGEWIVDGSSERSFTISDPGVTLGSCDGGSTGDKVSLSGATRGTEDNVMYLIPQESAEGAYIKVTARMTLQDVPGASYVTEETIPITVDWKEGQRYSYNIAWNATPITFDVTVSDFREVTATAE